MDYNALLYQALEPDNHAGLRLHFNSSRDREQVRKGLHATMAREFRRWGASDWDGLSVYREGEFDLVIRKRDNIQFTVEPYDKREK